MKVKDAIPTANSMVRQRTAHVFIGQLRERRVRIDGGRAEPDRGGGENLKKLYQPSLWFAKFGGTRWR